MEKNNQPITPEVAPLSFHLLEDEDIEKAEFIYDSVRVYVKRFLKKDIDYGTIPYCGNKKVLLKPGAEKLCRLFNLRPHFQLIDKIVDYKNKLFHYHYRCSLYRFNDFVCECDAIANSQEKKYIGLVNKDLGVINTLCKMAQKRALVGAVLIGCGASMYFTQDLDEYFEDDSNTNTSNSKPKPTKDGKGEISKEEYERRFK